MSKLLDRLHIHHEAPEATHEAPARLPESREVAEHRRRVTDEPPRAARGIRWLRWLPVVALFAVGILGLTLLVRDSGTDVSQDVIEWPNATQGPGSNSLGPTPAAQAASAYQLVQDSVNRALAANQPATLDVMVQDLEANAAITPASSYQLVQDAIDEALAANQPATLDVVAQDLEANAAITPASSYQLVQDAIDEALAANQSATEAVPLTNPTTGPGSTSLGPTD